MINPKTAPGPSTIPPKICFPPYQTINPIAIEDNISAIGKKIE